MPRGNPWGLRIGLLGYAFFYAPITPFCFILSNRLGARTDQTAAMGIVGVNLGAGFGPMLYGAASGFAGASVLPWVVFFTFAVVPLSPLHAWYRWLLTPGHKPSDLSCHGNVRCVALCVPG